jgi:3'-phosphoadenosine 5'-phosphosulfate sulfotransferase (PAPS reductase)/FAD synthetase
MSASASAPASPSTGAARAKRYRERKKDGTWCVRIRMTEPAAKALAEMGFMSQGQLKDADVERAIYGLLNAARKAGLTATAERSGRSFR